MKVTKKINLDLGHNGVRPRVDVVQGDTIRQIEAHLFNNGVPWVVPENVTVAVGFRKQDGKRGLYDTLPDGTAAVTVDSNVATVVIAPQALTATGVTSMNILFHDPDLNQLRTFPFDVIVFENLSDGYVSNEFYKYQNIYDINKALAEHDSALEELKGKDPSPKPPQEAVLYTEQKLTEDQQEQARENIGAVSIEEVEEMLGIEEEFSVSGELVQFDLDIDPGIELSVVSKIHRDSTWGESNKLVLHHVSGDNFVDFSSYLGGAGKVYEKNGLTATVNEDCTLTVKGTSTVTGWTAIAQVTDLTGTHGKRIYPAGTYRIPSGLSIQIRAAQYPGNVNISGLTGNLQNKIVVPQPFRVVSTHYSVAGGATIDKTIPLGLFRSDSVPETDYEYTGNVYDVTFDAPVYDGEFNWSTGELKDADGNTVGYYDVPEIKRLPGTNYLWTGFGENMVSNRKDDGKTILRLNEPAPEETVPSICDFMLTPTTPTATYCLHDDRVRNGGVFCKHEIPLITTKGTISVVNSDGEVTTEKYVDALINWQGVSDRLTNKGVRKVWSDKFYITKEPVLQEDFSDMNNALYTFEFTEEDFQNVGIPAKLDNIPIVSPCFYTGANAASKLNSRVWGGHVFPATLSWDASSGKYIFKVRGVYPGLIMAQLTGYTKGYIHYQLETPYDEATTFAMGISSGDTVTFTADDSDWKPYLDGELYQNAEGSRYQNTEVDATPTCVMFVPRNAVDACDGMINAARMLNRSGSAAGDATVQGYSWIGEGDGSTDYTSKIQSKLDVLHSVTNGGTIYLGPGTYPISGSLFVYENTRIIGDGQTVIEQIADNTHALVLCGSSITIEDLSIKLSGECTAVTACIYANSNNKPAVSDYDSAFPETGYVQRLTVDNVFMSGKYTFGSENGYPIVSDAYENYMGVGIYAHRLFFNYAHIDNVHFNHLMAGVYGGGGSNYFNITSEFCKYGLYINGGGNNTYFVNGHPYYVIDESGKYITMSEAIAHVEYDHSSTYHLRCYDIQAYKKLAYFGPLTNSNKIDIQLSLSTQHSLYSSHEWDILKWFIVDYGRGNAYSDLFKNTPFHIGSHVTSIANGPQLELSNPVIQNALSGAGVWGDIYSNVEFVNQGITLRDVCRYPSEKTVLSNYLPYIVSSVAPSVDNPIEIIVDYSNRPVIGIPNYFIQFYHENVASDYVVSFDTTNTGVYDVEYPVTGNTNITEFFDYPQIGAKYTTYRMKISFTKALQIEELSESIYGAVFSYNPDGLIGICNIGMTVNDYAGRSFLGECGGSLYGNVDMHQNTLKNLRDPVDDGDAVSKSYLEAKLAELMALINGT